MYYYFVLTNSLKNNIYEFINQIHPQIIVEVCPIMNMLEIREILKLVNQSTIDELKLSMRKIDFS